GRHVVGCPFDRSIGMRTIAIAKQVHREPEVEQHDAPLIGHDDVRRLDVAMKLAGIVQSVDAAAQLKKRIANPVVIERGLFRAPAPLRLERFAVEHRKGKHFRRLFDDAAAGTNVVKKRGSLDELHREEPVGVVGDQLVKGDEIRMRDAGQGAELLLEAIQHVGIAPWQPLERNDGISLPVVGAIHDAETAGPQLSLDEEALRAEKRCPLEVRHLMTGDAGDVTTNVKGGYTGFRTIAVMSSESNRSSGAERQRAALRYRSRALRGQTRQPWTERAIRVVLAFGLPGTAWIVSNGNDHFRLPKELVFRGEAIVLLMLAVFWWTSRPRTWRLSFRPELALAFAVVAWGLVTTWSSTNRLLSEDSMITIAAGAVIFIVTCIALQTESMLLIDSLMLAACCNAILAIVQELKIWTPFRGAEVSTHMGTVGLLGNPNDVGTYLSGAALVAFAVAVNSRRTRRWVYASIALLLIVGIIASATKTAVIALAAALLVFGALHSRRAAIGVAALLAALAIAVAIPS